MSKVVEEAVDEIMDELDGHELVEDKVASRVGLEFWTDLGARCRIRVLQIRKELGGDAEDDDGPPNDDDDDDEDNEL